MSNWFYIALEAHDLGVVQVVRVVRVEASEGRADAFHVHGEACLHAAQARLRHELDISLRGPNSTYITSIIIYSIIHIHIPLISSYIVSLGVYISMIDLALGAFASSTFDSLRSWAQRQTQQWSGWRPTALSGFRKLFSLIKSWHRSYIHRSYAIY